MLVTGNNTTYYNLSIRVKAGGFSFCVTEGNSGDTLLCEQTTVQEPLQLSQVLSEKLQDEKLKEYKFSRVRVIIDSDATCIPQKQFNHKDLQDLYNLVFPTIDSEKEEVCYTHLPQLDIVEAYTLPIDIRQAVTAIYPEASFTNSHAVVLGRIATFCKRQQLQDGGLFTYVSTNRILLFSIYQDKLQFANSFPLSQQSDAIFFLLSVWKELNLNARKDQCYVAGEETEVTQLTEQAKKYLQNVQTIELNIEG